ncbi:hypothetical protein [Acinetobacter sp. YH12025]|uniref:hypothetical protein n=1 Tax=Acinetobacter sp. YH12025 TaxID=2601042 RepID=UPI0015D18ADF|nr:hypothetical protein [Acinetobacter sp. YH12025]
MLKTPLSTVIGGAFWTPEATILGGTSKTFDQIIKSLFENNEQGFFYDPNDLTTMFQGAIGTIPVAGAGQPVGLILDKSKGMALGVEIAPSLTSMDGWSAVGSPDSGKVSSDGASITFNANGTGVLALLKSGLSADKWYKASVTVSSVSGVFVVETAPGGFGFPITAPGTYSYFMRERTNIYFRNNPNMIATAKITAISVKELAGNHAYQTTSSMRPLLVASPQRLDFDTADDKLITNLPTQLTDCTMIRSVPNVGTQILTGQTIPATYEDNQDHCGLIVINRALTPNETSAITREFNKRAGV